jgi:hypothetical protein
MLSSWKNMLIFKPIFNNSQIKFFTLNMYNQRFLNMKFLPFSSQVTNKLAYSKSNKKFSGTRQKIYLNQQEAYILNEHDRMCVQLSSNSVPMTNLPKFMRELTEYCYLLSKYKEYIKGWNYIFTFYSQNLSNFSIEDLEFYVEIFSVTNYYEEKLWMNTLEEILKRPLDKQRVLSFLLKLSLTNFRYDEIFSRFARKVEEFELNYEDSLALSYCFGILYENKNDPIWERLLSNLENSEIIINKKSTLSALLNSVIIFKRQVNRDSPFYGKVIDYFNNNFDSIHPEDVVYSTMYFTEITSPNSEEIVRLIVRSLEKMTSASEFAKFFFYKNVLNWCVKDVSIITALNSAKNLLPSDFIIPTTNLIKDYDQFDSKMKELGPILSEERHSLNQNFWISNADKIGFNSASAQHYYLNGVADYESVKQVRESLNK